MNSTIRGSENGFWEGHFTGICSKRIKVKVSFGAAVEIGFVQVGSVTVDLESHVAAVETYGGIGVCGTVIYKLGGGLWFVLVVGGVCKGAYGNKHGGVDGFPIIQ